MATEPPDGMETGAAVILSVALFVYLVLTLGFVCGTCLLGVHGLLLVAGLLLAFCAAAARGAGRVYRRLGAVVLVLAVAGPWLLFSFGVFQHVGGATAPIGMMAGASISFLDRMQGGWRVAMQGAGAAGVIGLLLHVGQSGLGFLVHQLALLALAGLLVVMLVTKGSITPGNGPT